MQARNGQCALATSHTTPLTHVQQSEVLPPSHHQKLQSHATAFIILSNSHQHTQANLKATLLFQLSLVAVDLFDHGEHIVGMEAFLG